MVSTLMSKGNETAQVREELLLKMLAVDQKAEEAKEEVAAAASKIDSFGGRMNKIAESEQRIEHMEHAISGHFLPEEEQAEDEEAAALAAAAAVAEGGEPAAGALSDAGLLPHQVRHEKVKELRGISAVMKKGLQPVDRNLAMLQEQLDSLQEQMANTTLELSHLGAQRPRSPGGVSGGGGGGADSATVKLLEHRLEEMDKRVIEMEEGQARGAEKNKSLEDQVKVLSMELAAIKARPVAVARAESSGGGQGGGGQDMGPWLQQQAEHMAKENAKVISDVQSLRDQLRSLNKRVDGSADKKAVDTLGEDVESFKRQLHGRMLSLSSVQSSTGKQVEKLVAEMTALSQSAGGLQGTLQEVSRLSRGFDTTEARTKDLSKSVTELVEELHERIVPTVNSLGSRVGAAEDRGEEHGNALSAHSEDIKRRAKLTQIEALQTAVKNLMTMMQGNQGGGGGRGKKGGGKSAAGSYRCIVCDSDLDDVSTTKPWARDGFQPTATLTPELFFDGPRNGTERRPPSARSARSASPPEEQRMKALYNGRQPPGPAAVGGMEVAHGRSAVPPGRRARPQSAGPFAAGAVGSNPGRGRTGMSRPGSANVRPGSAMAARAPTGLLPGEGSSPRRGAGSPLGDGATSPPTQEWSAHGALANQGEDDPDAGGWRDGGDDEEMPPPERGPYAVREVYGV